MAYSIRKAAVIGSGTMGGGIATLLAGAGVDVTVLDIPAKGTQPGDKPAKRNALVSDNLKKLGSSRPPQVFAAADVERIRVGNIDDNLDMVSDADWIIEVVVERLDDGGIRVFAGFAFEHECGVPLFPITAHGDIQRRTAFGRVIVNEQKAINNIAKYLYSTWANALF